MMKRSALLLLLIVTGCSTAPVADVLDLVRPGRIGPGPYHGGVELQHQRPGMPPDPGPVEIPAIPVTPVGPPR